MAVERRRPTGRASAALALSLLLGGCYRTPPLAAAAEPVRLTYAQEQVRGCESKGPLKASDGRGGLFGKGAAAKAVDHKLRNEAAGRGANVILLVSLKNGFWGSSGQGEAFACASTP